MNSLATFRAVFKGNDSPILNHLVLRTIGSCVILLSLASCSGESGPKLPPKQPCIKVAGQVLVDGKPAEGVQVILHPTEEEHGLYQFPHGLTNADGEFELGTYSGNDGAPTGTYVAVFTWPIPIDEDVNDDDRLMRLYNDPRKSTHKVTIDGTQQKLDPFDLKLKGLKGIPLTKSELKKLKFDRKQQKVIGLN